MSSWQTCDACDGEGYTLVPGEDDVWHRCEVCQGNGEILVLGADDLISDDGETT